MITNPIRLWCVTVTGCSKGLLIGILLVLQDLIAVQGSKKY